MKKIIKIILLMVVFVASLSVQGCITLSAPTTYKGDNTDLYSEAIHSLLGITSSGFSGIIVLDEDEYGRKLFTADLNDKYFYNYSLACIFISQKTDDQYVYFYEDINYAIKEQSPQSLFAKETIYERFSSEEIELLKEQNDWGKEQNSKDLFKAPITGDKAYLFQKVSMKDRMSVQDLVVSSSEITPFPLCEDSFGNSIWVTKGTGKDDGQEKIYVALLNTDGKLKSDNAIMEIINIWDYRDQMIAFKEVNGWNIP